MVPADVSGRHALDCPLCAAAEPAWFHRDLRRDYYRCETCHLVSVPPSAWLSAAAEKACYDHHQNSPADARYRQFLGRLYAPLLARLSAGARGLDFGSGPGPTLSGMFAEAGFPTRIYDPLYAADPTVWQQSYHFVTASEVVEHLYRPMAELQRLWNVLLPGGWLGIMTKRVLSAEAFARWHYKNDPTHVIFFADETFAWLAARWRARYEVIGPDVVLFQKCIKNPDSGQQDSLSDIAESYSNSRRSISL